MMRCKRGQSLVCEPMMTALTQSCAMMVEGEKWRHLSHESGGSGAAFGLQRREMFPWCSACDLELNTYPKARIQIVVPVFSHLHLHRRQGDRR